MVIVNQIEQKTVFVDFYTLSFKILQTPMIFEYSFFFLYFLK